MAIVASKLIPVGDHYRLDLYERLPGPSLGDDHWYYLTSLPGDGSPLFETPEAAQAALDKHNAG